MKPINLLVGKSTAAIVSLCLVLILPMCTSMPAVCNAYAEDTGISTISEFSDMNNEHWACQSIAQLTQRGILAGYPDGSFQPGKIVTYGEFIKMAVEAGSNDAIGFIICGPEEDSSGKVEAGKAYWADTYYETALTKNYFNKNRITKKMLPYPISRRDMALISSSVLGKIAIKNYGEIQERIKDIDFRSPDEYEITKAYATGVLNGYPDGTFQPDRTLTRAEAAVSIERLISVVGDKKEDYVDGYNIENNANKPTEFPEELKILGYPVIVHNNSVPLPSDDKKLKPISELIEGEISGTLLAKVKYYWINEDYPYKFKTWDNLLGTQRLLFSVSDLCREVVLIQNDKIISTFNTRGYIYGVQGLVPGSRLPAFEYIGIFPYGGDIMMLITKPIL